MSVQELKAKDIAYMFLAGANRLNASKEWINELNVFPVPDGDTGTNMTMTILSAAKEVMKVVDSDVMELVCKAIYQGALQGARGNSGVILSQLLRGFTKCIMEAEHVDAGTIAEGFVRGTEVAYKAVMKPKEGTILTVAKAMANKAMECCDGAKDLESFAMDIIAYGDEVLSKTPDMLPALKEAGVVDSGGQGLMEIIKGAVDFLSGNITADSFELDIKTSNTNAVVKAANGLKEENIRFGYCTEFIIMLEKNFDAKTEAEFKQYLESIGDSVVCVAGDDIVKVHVHTNDPGFAIQKALKLGALSNMKIDNMRLEHHERVIKSQESQRASESVQAEQEPVANTVKELPVKKYGFVAVSVGEGLDRIFTDLGVDYIIPGGQTMNPSTKDILMAAGNVNAENIFVLPNNKNIILAAQQAQELCKDKNLVVIPTKTVPQGITAIISLDETLSSAENEENMTEAIGAVKSGQITYAVRDTVIDGKTIKQNDIMGIGDTGILAVGEAVSDVVKEMLSVMVDEDSSLISLYFGEDITQENASALVNELEELYPELDIELNEGGQPIYYFIVSVE